MRIIGGHDYYDGVVGFDNDRSRVFLRNKLDTYDDKDRVVLIPEKEEMWTAKWYYDHDKYPSNIASINRNSLFVIFCGKLYRGVSFHIQYNYTESAVFGKTVYIWTAEHLLDFFAQYNLHFEDDKIRYWDNKFHPDMFLVDKNTVEDYFKPVTINHPSLIEKGIVIGIRTRANRSGDLLSDGSKTKQKQVLWKVNTDGLDRLGFASAVSPWQAYQEIDMYLGTILVNDQDKMVKLSDDKVLKKHGFDKWSFRNQIHPAKPRGKVA